MSNVIIIGNYNDMGTQAGPWNPIATPAKNLAYSAITTLYDFLTTSTTDIESIKIADIEEFTSAGCCSAEKQDSSIKTLKRISGLTWQQIADLFNVSRRSVHLWDNGGPMNSLHTEKLERIIGSLDILRSNNPAQNRKLIMTSVRGVFPFDLLKNKLFDVFREVISGRAVEVKELIISERVSDNLINPIVLASAKSERIHEIKPTGKKVKIRKVKKRE